MSGGFTCRFCGTRVVLNGAEVAARVMTFIERTGSIENAEPDDEGLSDLAVCDDCSDLGDGKP